MARNFYDQLSRLERRIMDAVFRLGEASVADIVAELHADDAYHSIRVTIANLEKKGFLKHHRDGSRNVYEPTVREDRARKTAMDNLLRTFFDGRPVDAVLGFLDRSDTGLSARDIADIRAKIEAAEQAKTKK